MDFTKEKEETKVLIIDIGEKLGANSKRQFDYFDTETFLERWILDNLYEDLKKSNLKVVMSELTVNDFIRVENYVNRASIANTVCSMLTTKGGIILCIKNGGLFEQNEDATKASRTINNYLRKKISNFQNDNVKISVVGKKKSFSIVIRVKKSEYIHILKNCKLAFPIDNSIDKKRELIDQIITKHEKGWVGSKNQVEEVFNNIVEIIKDSTKEKIKTIEEYLDGYYKIGDFANGNKFYKYMSLESVLNCCDNSNLWFVEPTKWKDRFENYFYGATILGKKCCNFNPQLYATCMTNKRDSESAWRIYAYNTQGLASRCVELTINRLNFRKQLLNAKIKDSTNNVYIRLSDYYDIYEGEVIYKDESYILNLSKPYIKAEQGETNNEEYCSYFNSFTFAKYLNLMLMKRDAFRHESEIRFFIVPKRWKGRSKGHSHLDVRIDWSKVIEGVRYDINCSDYEKKLLMRGLKDVLGIEKDAPLPTGFRCEPYDVYQGPEPPTIQQLK